MQNKFSVKVGMGYTVGTNVITALKVVQGAFFNCSHPKISKCQPVSKLRPKKLEYQNCSHPKKKQRKKKVKVPELFPP